MLPTHSDGHSIPLTPIPSRIAHGLQIGGIAGCLGTLAYVVVVCLLGFGMVLISKASHLDSGTLTGDLLLFATSIVIGVMLGGVPAVLLSLITSGIIGGLHHLGRKRLTLTRARWVGALVCGLLALLMHIGFWWWHILETRHGIFYVVLLGLPTLIYLGVGIWLSGHLFQRSR